MVFLGFVCSCPAHSWHGERLQSRVGKCPKAAIPNLFNVRQYFHGPFGGGKRKFSTEAALNFVGSDVYVRACACVI